MSLELVFSIFNTLILPQWLLMIFAPQWKWTRRLTNSYIIPLSIAVAYAFLILPNFFSNGIPDFGTFEGVKNLFKMSKDQVIVGAWFHYLAFDLVVGCWILNDNDSQKNRIKHWFIAPCLFLTLMTGPLGFLAYQIIKKIFKKVKS